MNSSISKPSVSILTLTQLSRSECLKILYDLIKNQTWKNIKEWIIIDGSKSTDEGLCNQVLVNELINSHNLSEFEIKYISYEPNLTIGQLKNKANKQALGDYIIWMDDDDYHMPSRIEYSINKLMYSNKLIGANINIYLHDIDSNLTVKTNVPPDINNKIVPNTLVYSKEFLNNHSYPENLDYFNEEEFKGTEPFEIFIPETTLIKILHNENTLNQKQFVNVALNNNLPTIQKLEDNVRKFLIPDDFYMRYVSVLKCNSLNTVIDKPSEYLDWDIVYYTGYHGIVWDPSDHKLGGSEQAVVNLSENWVKTGKSVVVYGNFTEEKQLNGVDYKLAKSYPFDKKAKVLIVWRTPGIFPLLDIDFKSDKTIVDFHDNFSYTLAHLNRPKLLKFFEKVTKINFKSQYHKESFEEFINGKIQSNEYNIIPNGLRIEPFLNNTILNDGKEIIRNPYRFCYCSSYDRGLEYILSNVWPIIHRNEPRAEFHVYYGMDYIFDDNFKLRMRLLLSQPGVMDHGRQPMEMIIREKYLSTFHLYLSTSEAEIDCISVRESLITGCIPIISKFGIFATRHGLQYEWEPENEKLCEMIAQDIIQKMHNNDFVENARNQLKKSDTIIDWTIVANKWLETI